MIVELSKIKNVDELRKKATYQYNVNKQIEEMSEKGKLVYVTNDNFDYIKEKCKEHAISESDLINMAIKFFKNYDNEILKLISIYGFEEALEYINKLEKR